MAEGGLRVREKQTWKDTNGKVTTVELIAPPGTHAYKEIEERFVKQKGGRRMKPSEHFIPGIGIFRDVPVEETPTS